MTATLLTVSKMVVRGQSLSFWIYLLFSHLPLLPQLVSASTTVPVLQAPSLEVLSRSKTTVTLICRAPGGHHGVQFALYRVKDKVDFKEDQRGVEEAWFTIRLDKRGTSQKNLYCCLYKSQDGIYSLFSPYLRLENQKDAVPSPSVASFPAPVLSVEPPSGSVKRGDLLSFCCSLPLPLPLSQPQNRPQRGSNPVSFFLLKTAGAPGLSSVLLHPKAIPVSDSTDQRGAFSVGPVTGGEGGSYTCLYQMTGKQAVVNSTVSNTIQVTITDLMPAPTLVLQQHAGVLHLICTGSPAYPGAVFSLYRADEKKVPIATHHASTTHHQAVFSVPVQIESLVSYQCQYKVLLVMEWSSSEPSLPMVVSKGVPPPPPPGVDLPLVMGSFSAVVLFFSALALLVVLVHRKVKAAADEKKKREEAQFWSQAQNKDNLVGLSLRHSSFNSQGWANERTTTQSASRSPLWTPPLSTFEIPTFN